MITNLTDLNALEILRRIDEVEMAGEEIGSQFDPLAVGERVVGELSESELRVMNAMEILRCEGAKILDEFEEALDKKGFSIDMDLPAELDEERRSVGRKVSRMIKTMEALADVLWDSVGSRFPDYDRMLSELEFRQGFKFVEVKIPDCGCGLGKACSLAGIEKFEVRISHLNPIPSL